MIASRCAPTSMFVCTPMQISLLWLALGTNLAVTAKYVVRQGIEHWASGCAYSKRVFNCSTILQHNTGMTGHSTGFTRENPFHFLAPNLIFGVETQLCFSATLNNG
jgi:hypothetical protein